jgi:hypothetical protein
MADTLAPGQTLNIGQQLQSNNGRYILTMQADGNLVQYEGMPSSPRAVWATDTWTLPAAAKPTRAIMQQDGNFVLYNATGNPAWATGTSQPGSRLVLQDDRNLVVYSSSNSALWAHDRWIPTGPSAPTTPVTAFEAESVGYKKRMETNATLYRNGQLAINVFTRNDNWTGGLRGHVLVLVIDASGRAIYVSKDWECALRCSIWDPSCASYGRQTFTEKFPDAIGQYAARLDIYQADGNSLVDVRAQLIRAIKGATDVAQAVKDAIVQLA